MSSLVPAEVGTVVEGLPAHRTGVRLLPRVNPPVDDEVGAADEAFPALFTGVRSFPSVAPAVGDEVGLRGKTLATVRALERLLSGVDSMMGQKLYFIAKGLPAQRTDNSVPFGLKTWIKVLKVFAIRRCALCIFHNKCGDCEIFYIP